jgi:hypothetical protein
MGKTKFHILLDQIKSVANRIDEHYQSDEIVSDLAEIINQYDPDFVPTSMVEDEDFEEDLQDEPEDESEEEKIKEKGKPIFDILEQDKKTFLDLDAISKTTIHDPDNFDPSPIDLVKKLLDPLIWVKSSHNIKIIGTKKDPNDLYSQLLDPKNMFVTPKGKDISYPLIYLPVEQYYTKIKKETK